MSFNCNKVNNFSRRVWHFVFALLASSLAHGAASKENVIPSKNMQRALKAIKNECYAELRNALERLIGDEKRKKNLSKVQGALLKIKDKQYNQFKYDALDLLALYQNKAGMIEKESDTNQDFWIHRLVKEYPFGDMGDEALDREISQKNLGWCFKMDKKNVDLGNRRGETALHLAVKRWNALQNKEGRAAENAKGLVSALLQAGANPNYFNDKGFSPFMFAVQANNQRAVDLLLTYGGDFFKKEKGEKCAGDIAFNQNNIDMVGKIINTLKNKGAKSNFNLKYGKNKETALHWYIKKASSKKAFEDLLEIAEKNPLFSINATDGKGDTLLMTLLKAKMNLRNKAKIFKLLLAHGICCGVKNKEGACVFDIIEKIQRDNALDKNKKLFLEKAERCLKRYKNMKKQMKKNMRKSLRQVNMDKDASQHQKAAFHSLSPIINNYTFGL